MIKKIFLSLIFITITVLIINKTLVSFRVKAAKPINSIGKFKIIREHTQEYQPIETKVKVLPAVEISIKTKPVIKTKAKISTKTRKFRATHYISRLHYTSRYGTTLRWDAATMRYLSNMNYFEHNYNLRRKTIRKIEIYARKHHIYIVTMSMMDAMTK